MRLYSVYYKLLIKQNKTKYLVNLITMLVTCCLIILITVYMERVLTSDSGFTYTNLRYIFISIRTIVAVGGISFLLDKYAAIITSKTRIILLLKSCGVNKNLLRLLFLSESFLYSFLLIPLSVCGSCLFTGILINSFGQVLMKPNDFQKLSALFFCFLIVIQISCLFISASTYLNQGIEKNVSPKILKNEPVSKGNLHDEIM